MKKCLFLLCSALALLSPRAYSIEVPLHYVRPPEVKSPALHVSAVRVATSDISRDPTSAPYLYDVGTSSCKGLALTAGETSITEQAGRKAASPVSRNMPMIVEDENLRNGKHDLWVAVDYFDADTSQGQLSVNVRAKRESPDKYVGEDGPEFTGSGTWKQHVFHIKDVEFPPRDITKCDIEVWAERVYPYSPTGYAFSQAQVKAPEGTFKLPAFVCKQPAYSKVKLGGKERLLVLDKANESDKFYSRLYFDANGNSDLTDDKFLDTTPTIDKNSARAGFGVLETTVDQGGKQCPVAFRTSCAYYGTLPKEFSDDDYRIQKPQLQLNTAGYYAGAFQQDGKTWYVGLGDEGCDGTFNSKLTPQNNSGGETLSFRGDSIALSTDQKMKNAKSFILGDQLLLGKQLYDVAVDIPGGKMTLTPVSGGDLGTLKLPQAVTKLQLINDQKKSVMCMDCSETLQLPAAQYAFYDYTLERTEPTGGKWRLSARATVETTATKLAPGSEATLVFGEPFRPAVGLPYWERQNMRNSMPGASAEPKSGGIMAWFSGSGGEPKKAVPRRSVNLEMQVQGAGRELLSDLKLIDGKSAVELDPSGDRPLKPSYTIAKPDGEIVGRGTFEYG